MGDYDIYRKHLAGSAVRSSRLRVGHTTTGCVVVPAIQGLQGLYQCSSDILLALNETKISPSSVLLGLSKFPHVERRFWSVIVVT
jgi:hypothetical protein